MLALVRHFCFWERHLLCETLWVHHELFSNFIIIMMMMIIVIFVFTRARTHTHTHTHIHTHTHTYSYQPHYVTPPQAPCLASLLSLARVTRALRMGVEAMVLSCTGR